MEDMEARGEPLAQGHPAYLVSLVPEPELFTAQLMGFPVNSDTFDLEPLAVGTPHDAE